MTALHPNVEEKIITLRNQQVILFNHVAELYGMWGGRRWRDRGRGAVLCAAVIGYVMSDLGDAMNRVSTGTPLSVIAGVIRIKVCEQPKEMSMNKTRF